MKLDTPFYAQLLDSLKDPFLFVDNDHVVRYLNRSAVGHYDQGAALIGTSIFDCHNGASNDLIREVFAALQGGADERMITDNEKHRIYLRAVRADSGDLVGYYERYESPVKQAP